MIYKYLVILAKSGDWNFADGWSLINRKRDDLDYEWESTISFIKNNIFWFIAHLILSCICQQIGEKVFFFNYISKTFQLFTFLLFYHF